MQKWLADWLQLQKGFTRQFSQYLYCRTRRGGTNPYLYCLHIFRDVTYVDWPLVRLYTPPEFSVIFSGQEHIFSRHKGETTVNNGDG